MKKHSFKKSAALFSILLGAYGIIYACADYFWGYDYHSNFTPEVYVDKSYAPLFYAPSDIFYEIGFDTEHIARFNNIIEADWSDYLKGKVTKDEINFLLLNDTATATVEKLYNAILKKQAPPANYSRLALTDEKVKGFIEFLHYARAVEASSLTQPYSWDYDDKKLPVVTPTTIAQVEKMYTGTKDEFLKNRYWFQAMKAYFYSANKAGVLAFFDRTKASVPKNTLYYRGLGYVAGVQYNNKNYATANYLYSIVFDKCPEMRTIAIYNFRPKEDGDFQGALAQAKTPEEKAALWSLSGYYGDEKQAIREIYRLAPASPHLDFLLTRLVNKEEITLNELEFSTAADYRNSMKTKLDQETLQLVSSIAKEGKTGKPYLWNLAAGYLNIFAGNHAQATQLFEKVEKEGPKSDIANNQIRLMKIINAVYSINTLDEKTETRLLNDLNWLYSVVKADQMLRYSNAVSWSRQYISAIYKSQGNIVYAELFNRKNDFYQTPSNLEAMKTFLKKPSRSPWEKLAESLYNVTLADINQYEGITRAYAGKLDEAITFLSQNSSDTEELPGNPFNGRIKDCHDCDHEAYQKVKYTRETFLKKMQEMQSYVDKGQDVYNNSLLLGNAYYNMSYYGNARAFYYNNIIDEYSNYVSPFYQPMLLSCATARKHYQRAFDAATTPEQKAKCAYMLAKCERNEFYTKRYFSRNDFYGNTDVDFLAWEGFKMLKNQYSTTKYYKDVLNECGYFRSYTGGR